MLLRRVSVSTIKTAARTAGELIVLISTSFLMIWANCFFLGFVLFHCDSFIKVGWTHNICCSDGVQVGGVFCILQVGQCSAEFVINTPSAVVVPLHIQQMGDHVNSCPSIERRDGLVLLSHELWFLFGKKCWWNNTKKAGTFSLFSDIVWLGGGMPSYL